MTLWYCVGEELKQESLVLSAEKQVILPKALSQRFLWFKVVYFISPYFLVCGNEYLYF